MSLLMLLTQLACYGIIHVPEGDEPWYCERCAVGVKDVV